MKYKYHKALFEPNTGIHWNLHGSQEREDYYEGFNDGISEFTLKHAWRMNYTQYEKGFNAGLKIYKLRHALQGMYTYET